MRQQITVASLKIVLVADRRDRQLGGKDEAAGPHGNGKFGAADIATARNLQQRGIPLAIVEDAMLLGASRKYMSWFEGNALEPIQSLAYFKEVIAEVQDKPFPPGYSAHLRKKVRELDESWSETVKSGKATQKGGCPTMAPDEIVQ